MTDTTRPNPYQHTHPVRPNVPDCPACQLRHAAPLLFEALEAVEFAARIDCPRTVAWNTLLETCRAALAAARGEG